MLSDDLLSTSVSYEPCASSNSGSGSFVIDSLVDISLSSESAGGTETSEGEADEELPLRTTGCGSDSTFSRISSCEA